VTKIKYGKKAKMVMAKFIMSYTCQNSSKVDSENQNGDDTPQFYYSRYDAIVAEVKKWRKCFANSTINFCHSR
jgi:hypothetical protein